MKKNFTVALLLMLVCLSAKTVDRIVAKIGKEIIMQSQLDKRFEQYKALQLITDETSKFDVLEEMIESELVILAAREQALEPDKLEIKSLAERQIDDIKKNYPSELEFLRALKAETGMTPTELKDYYITMMTEERLKDNIINNVIKQKTNVTDSEIKEFYDENIDDFPLRSEKDKLGMILINVSAGEKTRDKALKSIIEIKSKIDKGQSFTELAEKFSDCPSSKNGGDLGFFKRGLMVKPFENAAFKLNVGEVSDIVETQFGYHIILMEEKKDDEIRVRHILKKIEPSKDDRKNASELIYSIKEKLENGEDFAELARAHSMDDSSAANGGVIGEFSENEYPELFKEYIINLDYGEYSEVIQEGDSYYIFAKLEKVDSRKYTLEELYDNLKERVIYQKQSEIYDRWINDLKKETYIEVYL